MQPTPQGKLHPVNNITFTMHFDDTKNAADLLWTRLEHCEIQTQVRCYCLFRPIAMELFSKEGEALSNCFIEVTFANNQKATSSIFRAFKSATISPKCKVVALPGNVLPLYEITVTLEVGEEDEINLSLLDDF